MTISSRTPEGFPSHCSVCGAETPIEFSMISGDATCPDCGHLLWFTSELFRVYQHRMANLLGVPPEEITADTNLVDDLGADSLDTVELVMMLEEAFDIEVKEEDLHQMQTVADAIRFLEQREVPVGRVTSTNPGTPHRAHSSWLERLWRAIKGLFQRKPRRGD